MGLFVRRIRISLRLALTFGLSVALTLAAAFRLADANDDPCGAFTWDVHHERALFATKPQILTGGQTVAAAPTLTVDRLTQVELKGQSEVRFPEPPGKKRGAGQAYAGLARLTVDTEGVYRISLDQPLWVDVIANGAVIPAKYFQGRPGCNAPHKVVEFVLPARLPITLQLSGGGVTTVRITVTRARDAASERVQRPATVS